MTPELKSDSTCQIGGLELRVGQSIDFRNNDETVVTMGTIKQFKHPGNYDQVDKSSVWMLINELEGKRKDWISVLSWYNEFGIKKDKKEEVNASPEPEANSDLPF